MASTLHALTPKNVPFIWDGMCDLAFTELKEALTTAPVLAFQDFNKEFLLETDASSWRSGLGAVLAQKSEKGATQPLAYASHTL